MKMYRSIKGVLVTLALLAPPAMAGEGPVMFPPEQFGQTYLTLPQSTVHLENVLGKNPNFEKLSDYAVTDRLRELSNPVGRLDLLVDYDGHLGVVTCTASIISDDYVLTNNHCAPGKHNGQHIKKVQLLMNFYGVETEDKAQRFDIDLHPVEQDAELDYAIYRVLGDPAKKYGHVVLTARDPIPGESLVIIHHPAGLPKYVTRGGCRAVRPKAIRQTDILHRCDTLPGSSGSPIIASSTGHMVGLHYAGSSSPTSGSYNYGKRLVRIARASRIIQTILQETTTEKKVTAQQAKLEMEQELRRREAEFRAKLEKEMKKKLQRSRAANPDGATTRTAFVMRPPLSDNEKFDLADVSVPLPQGTWRRIFHFRSRHNRRKIEIEYGALADMRDGRVRQLLVTATNTGGRDKFWKGNSGPYCEDNSGVTYFSKFDNDDASRAVCWRFRTFRWSKYPVEQAKGGLRSVRGLNNKIAFFLTKQNEFAGFYGFTFHVSVGGQFVRALYAFNRDIFNFEKKLCCGNEDAMRVKVTETADKIRDSLRLILQRKAVDFTAVGKLFAQVKGDVPVGR